jgi:putative flippase GtrA
LQVRIVRFTIVGLIGVPIHLLALAVFLHFMTVRLYPLALVCAFEFSTTINFVLNQRFTYHEQKHLHGWDWPKRALRAQLSSISAQLISYSVALLLTYGPHLSPYLASVIGIFCAFFVNFTIANRFVFRPSAAQARTVVLSQARPRD